VKSKVHIPRYVILKDAGGREIDRLRSDRMNFAAATHVIASYQKDHGELTITVEDINPDKAAAE